MPVEHTTQGGAAPQHELISGQRHAEEIIARYRELDAGLGQSMRRLLAAVVLRDATPEHTPVLGNPETLRERAETMDRAIETQLAGLRERYTSTFSTRRYQEIDAGEDTMHFGEAAWAHDVVVAMLRGEPTKVWLNVRPPVLSTWEVHDSSGVDPVDPRTFDRRSAPPGTPYVKKTHVTGLDGTDLTQIELAASLYAIKPAGNAMRIVLNLQDSLYANSAHELSVLLAAEVFERYGLPSVENLGRDVLVTDERTLRSRTPEVINRLIASGNGYVDMEFGQTAFVPAAWLKWWYDLQRNDQPLTHEPLRVPLGTRRVPGMHLGRLAAFLASGEAAYNHVLIGTHNATGGNEKLRLMLRALDIVHKDTCQILASSSHIGNYKILKTLQNEVRKYLYSLNAFASFDEFDGEAYLRANYPPTIMRQDREIMQKSIEYTPLIASVLEIDPERPETLLGDNEAVHVCAGVNMYPIMLRSWMTRRDCKIAAWDIAPKTKEYMDKVKYEGYDAERWDSFQEFMVATEKHTPELYEACAADAKGKLDFVLEDIDLLPEGQYRYMGMHFGREANVFSQGPFYKTARVIRRALKDENSIFEGAFTIGSGPWPDGTGQEFPAVSMLQAEIVLALVDAGMEVLVCEVIGRDVPPEERVRPDEEMLYVLARPRRK